MALAADDQSQPGRIGFRAAPMSDGSSFLFGFTSAPEVVAFNPGDAVMSLTTGQVLDKIRRDGYSGIVVNPAGPSVSFSNAEMWGSKDTLP